MTAPLKEIMLKHILYEFFMSQFEGQNKNFWIVGAPFIDYATYSAFAIEITHQYISNKQIG